METIYYRDINNTYVGGFYGAHGVDVSSYFEVPLPPANASYVWSGTQWNIPI